MRAFLTVAEEGSITGAARRLSCTQPALSRQIKALEEELGVALFERGAHSVSLTPAGEQLAKDGAKWAKMADQVVERVRVAGLGEALRIGYAPSLAGSLLGMALEWFSQRHPGVRVQLADRSTAEMKAELKNGGLDLIVGVPDADDAGIEWTPVAAKPWKLALAETHPLAGREKIRPQDLEGVRMLMFGRDDYPEYWRQVGVYLRENQVNPVMAGECDGIATLATAVGSGMGVALVADGTNALTVARVVLRELEPGPEPIVIAAGVLAGSEAGLPCRVLVEELKKAAEALP